MKNIDKSEELILRQMAEESLKKKQLHTVSHLSDAETLKLIHELEVHQIELEMQNEELVLARSNALESNEKYIELYDFAPSGYVTLTVTGEIQRLNHACARMVGKERSLLINRFFTPFVSEDTREVFHLFLQKVFKSAFKESCEIMLKKDASMPIYVHIEGIISENGKQCFATLTDITYRKQKEEELLKLNMQQEKRIMERTAELTAANKEIESFAYSVSHDLRTPLRHIHGFIEMLREMKTTQRSEQEISYLNIISEGSSEMGKLIDALLAFSRLNRTELQKTNLNTFEIVKQVIRFFDSETQNRIIKFDIGHIPDCEGDERLIKQVWINLISNAIKYTGKKNEAVIEIGSIDHESETVYFVKDNGVGFNMQYANKLFGVFQRLHKPRDFEGIGIGLANVNSIIIRHNGSCSAEGEVNKGATFYFSLPK
ncbi:MAG: ATP-binding protein [Bacteroidota bacterium]